MADLQHKDLPESQLHEPKGVSTASSGEVYVANGSGSGSWQELYTSGWEDQSDTATATTPLVVPGDVNFLYLTNDGLGSFTNEDHILPGRTSAWNPTLNQFEWGPSGMEIGDSCLLRVDLEVVTSSANQELEVFLEMASGSGTSYDLNMGQFQFKTVSPYPLILTLPFYIGNSLTQIWPAKIKMRSDASANVQVYGWYLQTTPKKPILV